MSVEAVDNRVDNRVDQLYQRVDWGQVRILNIGTFIFPSTYQKVVYLLIKKARVSIHIFPQ